MKIERKITDRVTAYDFPPTPVPPLYVPSGPPWGWHATRLPVPYREYAETGLLIDCWIWK
jgi:hypothetical protein